MFWANVLLHITGFNLRSSFAKDMALIVGILSDVEK
jgi:hypothetical protein